LTSRRTRCPSSNATLSAGTSSTLVLPAGVELSLETGDDALEAIVCLPVGGHGVVGDGEPFTPPWAE
jgi:hypothetical protein